MKASFFAKILLFGEYGIIKESMGLSIPYRSFSGVLHVTTGELNASEHASNVSLKAFADYLRGLQLSGQALALLDLDRLDKDIHEGLIFNSSIPQGYGVGSSGALVAAIYATYSDKPLSLESMPGAESLAALKRQLAQMETFFHGKSSGIDPVICYLQLPLLISSDAELGAVGMPDEDLQGQGAIFLLNSGGPGETQPMVSIFMNKLKEAGFRRLMTQQFKSYNDACIQAFLKGDWNPLFNNLKSLSHLVLDNFRPMIPDHLVPAWQKGIDSNAYYLKLCGSGGGGYVLGFTKDYDRAKDLLADHDPELVLRF